ncbi:KAT8 regulatory NSL complex subunit 1-like protein isoform X2 [Lissotriton helveticus]
MTPALTEAVSKAHEMRLPSPFSLESIDSGTTECTGSQCYTDHSMVLQNSCYRLGYPGSDHTLHTNIANVKHVSSSVLQSSSHFQTVFLLHSNCSLNLHGGHSHPYSLEVKDSCKLRRSFQNGTQLQLGGVCHPKPETQVKRELFPGSVTQLLADVHRLLDVAESSGASDARIPNCKLYGRNSWVGNGIAVQCKPKSAVVLPCSKQSLHGITGVLKSCTISSKEKEAKTRLQQCLSRQHVLDNRAIKTQKHLHALLAKHVVEHCSHQMRCFVKYQLQRMQLLHKLPSCIYNSANKCNDIKSEASIVKLETSLKGDSNGFVSFPPSHELWDFAHCSAGLLSHMERNLDSDVTGSSSDEDLDKHPKEQASFSKPTPEWMWYKDRARIGSRWSWLQAQISQLECKIQRLADIYRQLRTSKRTVILEEFPMAKDLLKQSTPRSDPATTLNTAGTFRPSREAADCSPSNDFEMSPSSPTLLLRNIEKQSAQLTEIVNSLMVPLNLSPTSPPQSSKSYHHKRLANGISLSVLHSREEEYSSKKKLSGQQHMKKRKKDHARVRSPSINIAACTSARSRPLHCLHRRKLYKLYSSCPSNTQVMPPKDAVFQSGHVPTTALPAPPWRCCDFDAKCWIPEMDPSFHPVLSLPSDVALRIHLENMLKNNYELNGYYPLNTVQTDGFKMSLSNESVHFESTFPLHQVSYDSQPASTVSDFTMTPRSSHKPSTQGFMRRRLRGERSYDIDNIVIPMSLVATTKVEKLHYKEILTPSWRVVAVQPFEGLFNDKDELEDLSDEVFSFRHEKHEEKEKAWWSLWVQTKCQRRTSRQGCSSKYPDGVQGHNQQLKENPNSSCSLVYCDSEVIPNTFYLETSGSENTWVPQYSEEEEEEKPEIWEHRVFPLNDEDAAALLSPREPCNCTERPDVPTYRDCSYIHKVGDVCALKTMLTAEEPGKCQATHSSTCSSTLTAM